MSTHELTGHQEHFDFLVKRVEEDDLKQTRLQTQLEVGMCNLRRNSEVPQDEFVNIV